MGMVASKRAQKVRDESEFSVSALKSQIAPRHSSSSVHTWTVPEIRNARDAQLTGDFSLPFRLAAAMRTNSAMYTAWENRLAPQRAIGVELVPKKGARGKTIAAEADALYGSEGVGIHPDTLSDIHSDLITHGIAIGVNRAEPRDDGSRVDLIHEYWPLEYVRWREHDQCLMAQIETGEEIPIVHADGRWVVYRKHTHRPWQKEACLLPGALIWAAHAHSIRDWTKGSTSHGNAKVVGTLPEGTTLQKPDGAISDEAKEAIKLLRAIASLDMPVGLKPFGMDLDYLMNTSNAWQVWEQLAINAEKAAARVYLGTDGMLGSIGGAPGVDIGQLFGVATTKVQGDFGAIERGTSEGVIEPWSAINFGDSRLAPRRRYMMPDADKQKTHEDYAKRSTAFHADVTAYRAEGFVIDQPTVNRLAELHGVEAPTLAPQAPAAGAPNDAGAGAPSAPAPVLEAV